MIVRTDGLVLRTHKMTESSLVVVVYTRAWGKVKLVAKGARRPKSRFGAAFQPITLGSFVYYRKEGRDLQTASEGDIHLRWRQGRLRAIWIWLCCMRSAGPLDRRGRPQRIAPKHHAGYPQVDGGHTLKPTGSSSLLFSDQGSRMSGISSASKRLHVDR